jgi:hypothetical protein
MDTYLVLSLADSSLSVVKGWVAEKKEEEGEIRKSVRAGRSF